MKAVAVAGVPLAPRAPLLLSLSPVCQRSSLFAAPGRCSLKAGAKVRTLSARAKLFGNFFQGKAKFFGIVDRREGEHIVILSGGGRNRWRGRADGADKANKTNKANWTNWAN